LHFAIALAGASAVHGAGPPEFELAWSAPDECPDRAELMSRVERLLGGVVKSKLTAEADVTHTDGVYRARLRVVSAEGSGERVLENEQCDLLTDSVALVIALSASPPAESQPDDARPEDTERLSVLASAEGDVVFGSLPHPAFGAGGAIGVEGLSSLRFELRGAYYGRQSATFDGDTLGARFGLVTFGARACRLWSFGAADLAPCIGAEAYLVTATGFGGAVSRHQETSWWGPAVGLFGRMRVTRSFAVYFAVDGTAQLTSRRFVFSDVGELYRPTAVALELLVAPEVRF
jgi:hypothetical protein